MKDIITIVVRLTISCLLAATVMGLFFILTSNAKKHNEHVREQQVMFDLLGYKGGKQPPATLAMHEIYRYVVTGNDRQSIAFLMPKEAKGEGQAAAGYLLVSIDLNGQFIKADPVALSEKDALEPEPRLKAVEQAVGPGYGVKFADQTVIVTENGRRVAYLVGGRFQGFKTFVKVMLAVDPSFAVLGLEILEHEEDPGLGAEIEQDYFKNQFKGKSFEALKGIGVVKEPLPGDYLEALNGRIGEAEIEQVEEKYKDKDIYALTGATISSKAVANGVKGIVTKFAYRMAVLDKVMHEQQLAASF